MRIVSLLASATEMIAELGCLHQLVGRSHECDYPPEVQQLPLVSMVQINVETTSKQIDAQIKELAREKQHDTALKALSIYAIDTALLQQLKPDVIFTQTQCEVCAVSESDVLQALRHLTDLQPRIVSLTPYILSDVWDDLRRIGQALGRVEQAERLVAGYRQRLEKLHNRASALNTSQHPPRVVVLEWLDPLMGAGNWIPELIAYAGGEAAIGETGIHSPWLNWAELQAADPDVIVLCPCGFTLERTMIDVAILQKQPAWQSLRAVQQQQVYAIDGNYYLNRSGPRLVESAELLGRILWGERLEIVVDEPGWQQIT